VIRWLWASAGSVALALGVIGMFLPLLPTVPFFLAAGFFFGKSSPRLHRWLLQHPVFGPPIHNWNQRGAISLRAKLLASLSIAATFGLSLALGFSNLVIAIQTLALIGVSIFIWTRPDR
jgi:uncharacterized protein